ncbi:MAG: DNA/RNA nuclease SfsA, partial [Bacillota bacterium]|nr:DNA/RNA nuclease SfsA [Bacillota bacterium]
MQRLNRFAARVEVEGTCHLVHVPTSGRLAELLVPGAEVRLLPARYPHRHTRYTLVLVRTRADAVQSGPDPEEGSQGLPAPPVWVDLRAAQANALFLQALRQGFWPELAGLGFQQREVFYADSRLDFALGPAQGSAAKGRSGCLVEVKSVTLVRAGKGLFPDAPTERGTRHLAALWKARA